MVDTGELESYLNDKSAKAGDIVEILAEGIIEEIKQQDGSFRKALNLPVKLGDRKLIWSPGRMAIKPLQVKFGLDSKKWVGKKGVVGFVKKDVFGETKDILILDLEE